MLRVGLSLHYNIITFPLDILMWLHDRPSETVLLPWGHKILYFKDLYQALSDHSLEVES